MDNSDTMTAVRASFARIEDCADDVARSFYERLFAERPSVRPLFNDDLSEQRVKLMRTLALVVNNLSEFERVRPLVEALGRRHLSYGVQSDHYDVVGVALLSALADGLGEHFTDDVRAAWTKVYGQVADIMIEAAERAESEAAEISPASYLPGGEEFNRQRELDTWMASATRYRTVP